MNMADVDDVDGLLEPELTAEDIDQAILANTSSKDHHSSIGAHSDDSRTLLTDTSTTGALEDPTDDPELEAIKVSKFWENLKEFGTSIGIF